MSAIPNRSHHSNRLKAVIFDMDGVITMTMPAHYRVWKKIFADEGIKVSKLDVYVREGQKGLDSVLEIFAEHNMPMTVKRAKQLLARKEELFKHHVRIAFVPGARRFIREIRSRGIKLALVTGTAWHEVNKVLPADLRRCFDVIVSGSDVKHGKPHPEPYLTAIKLLNVGRGEAFVLENAPFGITSARRAGLMCVAIETSLPRIYLKEADHIIHDYHGLNRIVDRYKT